MGELLASRRAGRRLGLVVFLLIVPVVFLWVLYFLQARGDHARIDRERAGLSLAINIAPLLYGETARVTGQRLQIIAAAEDQLHIHGERRFAIQVAVMPDGDQGRIAEHVATLRSLFDTAVEVSRLRFEPQPESAALIQGVLNKLPELAAHHDRLLSTFERKLADGGLDGQEFRDLMRLAGRFEFAQQDFESDMQDALAASDNGSRLTGLLQLSAQLGAEAQTISRLAGATQYLPGQSMLMHHIGNERENQRFRKLAAHITHLGVARIDSLLEERRSELLGRFLLLTMAGLVFSVAGVGAAIFLFRRNLTQLDHVEAAKRDSDAMANQLAVINGEMSALNKELAENMHALKAAQDEVLKKGKMEQLGQLTATVAHELRNPLGTVRTSAFLLQRKLKGLNLDVDAQFERINNGISRCDSTITQLLDFSRTKKVAARPAVFDDWLAQCVEEAARHLPPTVDVDCTLGLGGQEVAIDAARMERAVVNLLNNAAEAMVGKGGTAPATQGPRIRISTSFADGGVVLRIADNGPGIPSENLERIREPLFTTKNFGTGLGIPAVEQIAAQHNGKLRIESPPGEGACFTIWLPLAQPEAAAA